MFQVFEELPTSLIKNAFRCRMKHSQPFMFGKTILYVKNYKRTMVDF